MFPKYSLDGRNIATLRVRADWAVARYFFFYVEIFVKGSIFFVKAEASSL